MAGKGKRQKHRQGCTWLPFTFHFREYSHPTTSSWKIDEKCSLYATFVMLQLCAPETVIWTKGRTDIGIQQAVCHRQFTTTIIILGIRKTVKEDKVTHSKWQSQGNSHKQHTYCMMHCLCIPDKIKEIYPITQLF